jgi:carbamoyltransferase
MWAADVPALFDDAIAWTATRGFSIDGDALDRALAPVRQSAQDAPDAAMNVHVQQERQAVAASFCARVNRSIAEMIAHAAARARVRQVGVAGAGASRRSLTAAIRRSLDDAPVLAPVPESCGRAIGAALSADGDAAPLRSLALGPDFTAQAVKEALENCRLDYLYEPDWSRLAGRVSRMLSRGTVVAWFQGAAGFGPRSIGTRSILCDPSNRYARENLNRFLRRSPIDDPLPVAMTSSAIDDCLESPLPSAFVATESAVKADWRDRFRAVLDPRQTIPVQMATRDQAPELHALLEMHRERTGVPGLISLPLAASDEPAACAPRDAVRMTFSSAVDALVIGRFLLMKDYWLLRSGAER